MINPMSLTFRLVSATSIFWLGFVILAALSLHGLHSMSRDLQQVHDIHMQASQTAAHLRQLIQDNRTEVLLTYQHAPDSPVAEVHDHPTDMHLKRLTERRQEIDTVWKRLEALTAQQADQASTQAVGAALQAWLARSDATASRLAQNDFSHGQLASFLLIGRNEGKVLFEALQALEAHHLEAASQLDQDAHDTYQRAWAAVVALLVLALGPATWLAWRGLRRLVGGLRYAQSVSSAIADGRMDPVPHDPRGDEVAALLGDMARMRDNLATLIGRVREVSESVEVASSEVAAGNQDLSVRTERTAGSLQQRPAPPCSSMKPCARTPTTLARPTSWPMPPATS